MLNLSVYGEPVLFVDAITRLLQAELSFKTQPIKNKLEYKHFKESNNKLKTLVYCANGYSKALFTEIDKLHRRSPNLKIILIISMMHSHFIDKFLNNGVNAIVSYKSSIDELIKAIQLAVHNQQYLSMDLSRLVINKKYPSSFNTLSRRELEITYMLANGMNIKSVSHELAISPKTVNTYRYRIFNKLAIQRNIDLFRIVSEKAAYMLTG